MSNNLLDQFKSIDNIQRAYNIIKEKNLYEIYGSNYLQYLQRYSFIFKAISGGGDLIIKKYCQHIQAKLDHLVQSNTNNIDKSLFSLTSVVEYLPKNEYQARPLSFMDFDSLIVFQCFVNIFYVSFHTRRKEIENNIVFSNIFRSLENYNDYENISHLTEKYLPYIKSFQNKILNLYNKGNRFFFKLDIQSFYSNIQHAKLAVFMNSINNVNPELSSFVLLFERYLNTFQSKKSKTINTIGLPQGAIGSDILAELFLYRLDSKVLKKYPLIRYVDDMIIYGKEEDLVRKNYRKISTLLQEEYGLSLNSNKTRLYKISNKEDLKELYLLKTLREKTSLSSQMDFKAAYKQENYSFCNYFLLTNINLDMSIVELLFNEKNPNHFWEKLKLVNVIKYLSNAKSQEAEKIIDFILKYQFLSHYHLYISNQFWYLINHYILLHYKNSGSSYLDALFKNLKSEYKKYHDKDDIYYYCINVLIYQMIRAHNNLKLSKGDIGRISSQCWLQIINFFLEHEALEEHISLEVMENLFSINKPMPKIILINYFLEKGEEGKAYLEKLKKAHDNHDKKNPYDFCDVLFNKDTPQERDPLAFEISRKLGYQNKSFMRKILNDNLLKKNLPDKKYQYIYSAIKVINIKELFLSDNIIKLNVIIAIFLQYYWSKENLRKSKTNLDEFCELKHVIGAYINENKTERPKKLKERHPTLNKIKLLVRWRNALNHPNFEERISESNIIEHFKNPDRTSYDTIDQTNKDEKDNLIKKGPNKYYIEIDTLKKGKMFVNKEYKTLVDKTNKKFIKDTYKEIFEILLRKFLDEPNESE